MGAAALQRRFVTEQLQRQRTVSMATDDVFSARSRKCKGLDGDVDDYGGRRAVRRRRAGRRFSGVDQLAFGRRVYIV